MKKLLTVLSLLASFSSFASAYSGTCFKVDSVETRQGKDFVIGLNHKGSELLYEREFKKDLRSEAVRIASLVLSNDNLSFCTDASDDGKITSVKAIKDKAI